MVRISRECTHVCPRAFLFFSGHVRLPRSYCGGKDYRIMSINCLPGNEPTCPNNPFKPFTDDEEGLKKDKLCCGSHVTRPIPTNKSQLHSACCWDSHPILQITSCSTDRIGIQTFRNNRTNAADDVGGGAWCNLRATAKRQSAICIRMHISDCNHATQSSYLAMEAQLVSQISICFRGTRLGFKATESRVNEVSFPKICSLECQTCACKCSLFAEMALDLIWQNVSGIPLSDAVGLVF